MKRDQFERQPATFPANFDTLAEAEADTKSKAQRTRFEHTQGVATDALTRDNPNG